MMRTAVYPGSFDPITYGHLDIIERASKMVDKLIIGVLSNSSKTPLFSPEERVNMIRKVTENIPNTEVVSFDGLLVDFVDAVGATIVVRGLRAESDFEYESHWAQANRLIRPNQDSIFLVTRADLSFVSSSAVRELARYNGDISLYVPPYIESVIKEKLNRRDK
jgi:pantetheine-phosphate adenylyltransferase